MGLAVPGVERAKHLFIHIEKFDVVIFQNKKKDSFPFEVSVLSFKRQFKNLTF